MTYEAFTKSYIYMEFYFKIYVLFNKFLGAQN